MDILVRIKRAVIAGQYIFSEKASMELEADHLTESDAYDHDHTLPDMSKQEDQESSA
jgi:hypothetical protein